METNYYYCPNSHKNAHAVVTLISTIEFGLGQDATTDDEAILLIAHIESRDRRMMRYLYMDKSVEYYKICSAES